MSINQNACGCIFEDIVVVKKASKVSERDCEIKRFKTIICECRGYVGGHSRQKYFQNQARYEKLLKSLH